MAELQLAEKAQAIAVLLYESRLLQTSNDPAVLALPFSALPVRLQTIYREAAEIAIRRMVDWIHAGALTNACRLAPGFVSALELYHRTLMLPAGPVASAVPPPPTQESRV
jgi:hypothetical protein